MTTRVWFPTTSDSYSDAQRTSRDETRVERDFIQICGNAHPYKIWARPHQIWLDAIDMGRFPCVELNPIRYGGAHTRLDVQIAKLHIVTVLFVPSSIPRGCGRERREQWGKLFCFYHTKEPKFVQKCQNCQSFVNKDPLKRAGFIINHLALA